MPFGCYASLRSLSYYLQFLLIPHSSYCVLHAASFIASSLRSSFIHFSSISPPAANICARRRCHRLRYGLHLAQIHAYTPIRRMPRCSPTLCVHRYRFTVRASRWRSQAISFVPLFIAFDGSLLASCRQVCGTANASFSRRRYYLLLTHDHHIKKISGKFNQKNTAKLGGWHSPI